MPEAEDLDVTDFGFDDADIAFLEGGDVEVEVEVKEEVEDKEEEEEEVVVRKERSKKDKKDKKEKKEKKEKKRRKVLHSDDEDNVVEVKEEVKEDAASPKKRAPRKKREETEDDDADEVKSEVVSEPVHSDSDSGDDSDVVITQDPNEPIKVIAARELVLTALRNGMPGKFFSVDEQKSFRATKTDVQIRKHLYTRNMILRAWDKHPRHRVYLSAIRKIIDPTHIHQPHSVFSYCEEAGLVNYGYTRDKFPIIQNNRSVVVVGAGISGLMAAQQLRRAGFTVTVVDGADEVGGRCKSVNMLDEELRVPIGAPSRYDLPEMMLGEQEPDLEDDTRSLRSQGSVEELVPITNPLDALGERAASVTSQDSQEKAAAGLTRDPVEHQKAVLHNLLRQARITDWDNADQKLANFHVFGPEGEHLLNPEDEIAEAEATLTKFMDSNIPEHEGLGRLREFIDKMGNSRMKDMCVSIVNGWEEQSHTKIENLGKHAQFFRVNNAYIIEKSWAEICQRLAKKLTVRLSCPVTDIIHSDSGVTVKHTNTADGVEELKCDYCVVTVPIGVLKASCLEPIVDKKGINFKPALGDEKLEALRNIGSGIKNTLVLQFERPFWIEKKLVPEEGAEPTRIHNMDFVMYKSSEAGLKGVGARGSLQSEPLPHAILTLSGDAAALAEEGSVSAVVDEAMAHLRKIFSEVEVPDPIAQRASRWGKNEMTRGSSPFYQPKTRPHHFSVLAKPVGALYFAGDATDPDFYGLLSGAVGSGLRASREVIQSYKQAIAEGRIRKPIPTPADRFVELSMNGPAPKLSNVVTVKKTPNAPVQVKGSSQNLAAKYARTEALPTMQRNLFNARVKPNDENKNKIGNTYMNVQIAKASAANQQSLAKLERQTELRWQEAKILRKRELAKEVASLQGTSVPSAKRMRPSTYMATNAVDDALPTWYYQQPKKIDERSREFATSFYSRTKRAKDEAEGTVKTRYLARLQGVIDKCMRRYTVPDAAKEAGTEIKIYATATHESTRKALVNSIVTRFQQAHETKVGRAFSAADWSELPKLTEGGVIAAIRQAIDKYFKHFTDPLKEAVIAKLGYDPNFEKPPAPETGARSEVTAKTGLSMATATSFLAQPHGYESAEYLPSAEYTPGPEESMMASAFNN
eukprot:TRINITY_DN19221_c0_g1_i2.p1 TRINITY_DN19221_c0_g1~~TRINITY_DN19221_c0_g1_i2.p1  ORF type:complete len:1158 (+),score=444.49 TRINITY_DN19221_c0_g1_i2:41-3475(+)